MENFPPFPVDAVQLPDYELGGLLLGWFIAGQAAKHAIPADAIPEDYAEKVRQYVLTLETDLANNAAVEKALHKAAMGQFETAGRLIRQHLMNGSKQLRIEADFQAILPLAEAGANFKQSQSEKAKRQRNRVNVDGDKLSITSLITRLAGKKDELGDPLPAKDLWNDLISELDAFGLNPKESTKYKKPVLVTFDKSGDGARGEVKYSSFKAMLSKARAKTC